MQGIRLPACAFAPCGAAAAPVSGLEFRVDGGERRERDRTGYEPSDPRRPGGCVCGRESECVWERVCVKKRVCAGLHLLAALLDRDRGHLLVVRRAPARLSVLSVCECVCERERESVCV